jgi:hypothetical protein
MKNHTTINISKDDLFHLAYLLRDDMQFCYDCIEAAPYSDAAEDSLASLKRSRSLLRRITIHVLDNSYEPTSMATRPHLN